MTTSKREAYVWIWLPGEGHPVVAGRVFRDGDSYFFNYGKSYLDRLGAIALNEDELPLRSGILPLLPGLEIPGTLRDALPDAWGRRVIMNRLLGARAKIADTNELDEITYMLESGSDRPGFLDFQTSPSNYLPRSGANVSLDELMASAEKVEQGIPLSKELDIALHHGSSIGGARPKALIEDGKKKYIAKFASSSDLYSVVKSEFVAMRLAKYAGLNVASVILTQSSKKDVLLVQRFDRLLSSRGWQRKGMVSALTMLGLGEMTARYASYQDLAEIVRHKFSRSQATLRELFSRIVFNVLIGNTDDHARNHAAFWDGSEYSLTPAFDICPQPRAGREASQAMLITGDDRMSRLATVFSTHPHYHLSQEDALRIAIQQVSKIGEHWETVCDEAHLSEADRKLLFGRQVLGPYAFEGLEDEIFHPLVSLWKRTVGLSQ
jgi:serine/threonine-protein kinase HipA